MKDRISILIFDHEGNCLWKDNLVTPFLGLQAGETFWFGSGEHKTWCKVIKIVYGLDTDSKSFIIEMIVEKTEKGATKFSIPAGNLYDHGDIRIPGHTGSWSVNNSDIILTTSQDDIYHTNNITLQVNTSDGPVLETAQKIKAGEFFKVKTKDRVVVATIIYADFTSSSRHTIFRVTESKVN